MNWRRRPELRWGAAAGALGALAAAAVSVKGILSSSSSTAAIGFLFVPVIAAIAAVPAALWGAALGYVLQQRRGARHGLSALLAAAVVAVVALPAYLGYETWRGLALEAAVRDVRIMDARGLNQAFDQSRWNHDRFFLGALTQNKAASAALLERVAALPDADLFERMGSFWDVMGSNRKGLAVMRLVAHHENASGVTLERLADHPQAGRIVHELASNPNTPLPVLARWYESTDYLAEWGLALNPNTPPAVMERLSRSTNLYTRMNLTYNKATPEAILERLANDPDPVLARTAGQVLERRRTAK
ncbi:MAG: hypothetical protein HY017_11460 [Betaproteobacteria bacterium]|nr:hypothetical protein [Betaproteobacteria bacterium]